MSAPTPPDLPRKCFDGCQQVHALIANVEADFCTGIPTTLIKNTAAPLLEVQAAVLEDPKVGLLLLCVRGSTCPLYCYPVCVCSRCRR